MADSKSPEDRSMSEILASIRRIVSDEEKARREAETTRRTHEKETGESVLTLTPDMSPEMPKGESLSEALGVTAIAAAATPEALVSAAIETTESTLTGASSESVFAPEPVATPRGYELPALELGKADLAADVNEANEPLVLRRSSLRRVSDKNEVAETPAVLELSEPIVPVAAELVEQVNVEPVEPIEEMPEPVETLVTEPIAEPQAIAPAQMPNPEPVQVAEPEPIPEPDVVAEQVPISEPMHAPEPPVAPTQAPTLATAVPIPASVQVADADEDGLLDDDVLPDPIMTEAEVEAIVRRVVREELQGPIGQQISRKVKRLIRDEIRKALYEDDSLI